jgi:hypothetical protein
MRKSQQMDPGRAMKLNRLIVNDHFTKLKNVMKDTEVMNKPELIYNMDENDYRFTIHHHQTVLARKCEKRVRLIAAEHSENVTIASCANVLCQIVPPMVLFKGKRLKP